MAKTLTAYLVDLSRDELEQMQRDIRAAREGMEMELRNIEFEQGLVSQALARKTPQSGSPTDGALAGQPPKAQVARSQVEDLILAELYERPFNSGDVSRAFARRDITVLSTALRHHLRGMLKAGKLQRYGAKEFVADPAWLAKRSSPQAGLSGRSTDGSPTAAAQVSSQPQYAPGRAGT